jgi:hypothetical protein
MEAMAFNRLLMTPYLHVNEVSKRSGTKIEVETYFGGILAKPADC